MNKTSIVGLFAIIIGIVYGFESYHLPKASIGKEWAPIYFPLGLGVLMVIFGIILFIQGVLNNKKSESDDKIEFKPSFSYSAKLITFTSLISIIYALLFERVGYIIATMIFLGSILFVVNGKKQWITNIIVSVGFSLVIYILFSKFLGISLPKTPYLEF